MRWSRPRAQPVVQGREQPRVLRDDERDQRHRHEEGPREVRREVVDDEEVCAHEEGDAEDAERADQVPLHGTLATTNCRSWSPIAPLCSTRSPASVRTRWISAGSM